jgi:hypothetical protein
VLTLRSDEAYSDIGVLFGWVMDRNLPHWVFGLSAVFMVPTVVLAPFTERKPDARLGPAEEPDAFLISIRSS